MAQRAREVAFLDPLAGTAAALAAAQANHHFADFATGNSNLSSGGGNGGAGAPLAMGTLRNSLSVAQPHRLSFAGGPTLSLEELLGLGSGGGGGGAGKGHGYMSLAKVVDAGFGHDSSGKGRGGFTLLSVPRVALTPDPKAAAAAAVAAAKAAATAGVAAQVNAKTEFGTSNSIASLSVCLLEKKKKKSFLL
jgi:hypothetical protein